MSLLYSLIPDAGQVLAMEPEELAGLLLELISQVPQGGRFLVSSFTQEQAPYHNEYSQNAKSDVLIAVAEAVSWMESQGLVVRDPSQPVEWLLLTRRGKKLKSRADVEAYRKARTLPRELLQPDLAEKVYHLFARGDHDTAVFQAFKDVEVAVRDMALRLKAAECERLYGRELMQRAFNPENGPVTDMSLPAAERQSEMSLFVGAIGHAKNPTSHREVNLSREEAARLIVFASYLLDRVTKRRP